MNTELPDIRDMKWRVFVYGSLKQGFGNHDHFLTGQEFLGERITADKDYNMLSYGAYPAAVRVREDNLEGGYAIAGELYVVDNVTLSRLDRLEGNGLFYRREQVDLEDEEEPAWMYLLVCEPPKSYRRIHEIQEGVLSWTNWDY
jgi:gamma-glutamylcyclotransferase (GGCT)/AIG2-like uncharacterized protein YtfP